MNSRERILENIKKNQPAGVPLPAIDFNANQINLIEKFTTVLTGIGGFTIEVRNWIEIKIYIESNFSATDRIISLIPELDYNNNNFQGAPHLLETVNLAILQGDFGVAENGAIWITNSSMGDRALPFITEHLALILNKKDIVPTLHQAYEKIGFGEYDLGVFIAGPSKTADIEQSLVLGAHGAKSLIVFLMD